VARGTFQLEGSVNSEKKTGQPVVRHRQHLSLDGRRRLQLHARHNSGIGVLLHPAADRLQPHAGRARLNYAGSSLQLTAATTGRSSSNNNGALTPACHRTLNNAIGAPLPAGPGVQSYLGQPVAHRPKPVQLLRPDRRVRVFADHPHQRPARLFEGKQDQTSPARA